MRTKLKNGGFDTFKKDKPTGLSIDKRQHRRTRFKRALQPLMERFGCTQMECANHVNSLLGDNAKLAYDLEKVREELENLRAMNRQVREFADKQIAELTAQLNAKTA